METMTLNELSKGISLTAVRGAHIDFDDMDDWQKESNDWRITLRYKGHSMSFDYWQGKGIKNTPTVEGIMENIVSDASVNDMSFEDFCAEFGYDTDSRKAERTYNACIKQTKALKRLLGSDFDNFVSAERD